MLVIHTGRLLKSIYICVRLDEIKAEKRKQDIALYLQRLCQTFMYLTQESPTFRLFIRSFGDGLKIDSLLDKW